MGRDGKGPEGDEKNHDLRKGLGVEDGVSGARRTFIFANVLQGEG